MNTVAWSNAVYAAHQAIKEAENRDYGDDDEVEKDLKSAIVHLEEAIRINRN